MKISGIGFVYMITSPSNRIYVGSTTDIDYRWSNYYRLNCKKQVKLLNSLRKHGVDNHVFEIVWAGDVLEMLKYETLIGWGFNVLEKESGLTLRLPKLGDVYSCMSNETKQKISDRIFSDETKFRMSESAKVKIFTESHRENISIVTKGCNNPFYGKTHSDETKRILSDFHNGLKASKETKDKMSVSSKIPILQCDLFGCIIKEWDSALDAGKELNINESGITQCCKGKYSTSKGFVWKYKLTKT